MYESRLTEHERDAIAENVVQSYLSKFGFMQHCEAINEASVSLGNAFEQAVKAKDEAQIGYCVMQILEDYARECAKPDIDEAVHERESELRRAS
jgi:hypothetical protein